MGGFGLPFKGRMLTLGLSRRGFWARAASGAKGEGLAHGWAGLGGWPRGYPQAT